MPGSTVATRTPVPRPLLALVGQVLNPRQRLGREAGELGWLRYAGRVVRGVWPGSEFADRHGMKPVISGGAAIANAVCNATGVRVDTGVYEGGDLIGKRGLERIREKDLRGEKGRSSSEVNARGFEQQQLVNVDPLPGNDIRLTIDAELQQAAEQFMKVSDKAGAVVAIEVNTGRLLTVASSPSINLEAFIGGISQKNWDALLHNSKHPLINKVVQAAYPPGSTYKMVTALAGLSGEWRVSASVKSSQSPAALWAPIWQA